MNASIDVAEATSVGRAFQSLIVLGKKDRRWYSVFDCGMKKLKLFVLLDGRLESVAVRY